MALDYQNRKPVIPGERYQGEMPHSEVCIHMRVAGKIMEFELLENERSVQLYKNGQPFSSPILYGEAGVFRDYDGTFYFYLPFAQEQRTS